MEFTEALDADTPVKFSNAEQYMMAHKALLFGDGDTLTKIMNTTSPAVAKKLGREIKNFDPATWDSHKFDIVVRGNVLKFTQNLPLMKRLKQTGNKTLVEASPYDKIWGCGLSVEAAAKTAENKWPGENLLGKALMAVRDKYAV